MALSGPGMGGHLTRRELRATPSIYPRRRLGQTVGEWRGTEATATLQRRPPGDAGDAGDAGRPVDAGGPGDGGLGPLAGVQVGVEVVGDAGDGRARPEEEGALEAQGGLHVEEVLPPVGGD